MDRQFPQSYMNGIPTNNHFNQQQTAAWHHLQHLNQLNHTQHSLDSQNVNIPSDGRGYARQHETQQSHPANIFNNFPFHSNTFPSPDAASLARFYNMHHKQGGSNLFTENQDQRQKYGNAPLASAIYGDTLNLSRHPYEVHKNNTPYDTSTSIENVNNRLGPNMIAAEAARDVYAQFTQHHKMSQHDNIPSSVIREPQILSSHTPMPAHINNDKKMSTLTQNSSPFNLSTSEVMNDASSNRNFPNPFMDSLTRPRNNLYPQNMFGPSEPIVDHFEYRKHLPAHQTRNPYQHTTNYHSLPHPSQMINPLLSTSPSQSPVAMNQKRGKDRISNEVVSDRIVNTNSSNGHMNKPHYEPNVNTTFATSSAKNDGSSLTTDHQQQLKDLLNVATLYEKQQNRATGTSASSEQVSSMISSRNDVDSSAAAAAALSITKHFEGIMNPERLLNSHLDRLFSSPVAGASSSASTKSESSGRNAKSSVLEELVQREFSPTNLLGQAFPIPQQILSPGMISPKKAKKVEASKFAQSECQRLQTPSEKKVKTPKVEIRKPMYIRRESLSSVVLEKLQSIQSNASGTNDFMSVFSKKCDSLMNDAISRDANIARLKQRPNLPAFHDRMVIRNKKYANRGRKKKDLSSTPSKDNSTATSQLCVLRTDECDAGGLLLSPSSSSLQHTNTSISITSLNISKSGDEELASICQHSLEVGGGIKQEQVQDLSFNAIKAEQRVLSPSTDESKTHPSLVKPSEAPQQKVSPVSSANGTTTSTVRKSGGGLWALPIMPKLPQKSENKPCYSIGGSNGSGLLKTSPLSTVEKKLMGINNHLLQSQLSPPPILSSTNPTVLLSNGGPLPSGITPLVSSCESSSTSSGGNSNLSQVWLNAFGGAKNNADSSCKQQKQESSELCDVTISPSSSQHSPKSEMSKKTIDDQNQVDGLSCNLENVLSITSEAKRGLKPVFGGVHHFSRNWKDETLTFLQRSCRVPNGVASSPTPKILDNVNATKLLKQDSVDAIEMKNPSVSISSEILTNESDVKEELGAGVGSDPLGDSRERSAREAFLSMLPSGKRKYFSATSIAGRMYRMNRGVDDFGKKIWKAFSRKLTLNKKPSASDEMVVGLISTPGLPPLLKRSDFVNFSMTKDKKCQSKDQKEDETNMKIGESSDNPVAINNNVQIKFRKYTILRYIQTTGESGVGGDTGMNHLAVAQLLLSSNSLLEDSTLHSFTVFNSNNNVKRFNVNSVQVYCTYRELFGIDIPPNISKILERARKGWKKQKKRKCIIKNDQKSNVDNLSPAPVSSAAVYDFDELESTPLASSNNTNNSNRKRPTPTETHETSVLSSPLKKACSVKLKIAATTPSLKPSHLGLATKLANEFDTAFNTEGTLLDREEMTMSPTGSGMDTNVAVFDENNLQETLQSFVMDMLNSNESWKERRVIQNLLIWEPVSIQGQSISSLALCSASKKGGGVDNAKKLATPGLVKQRKVRKRASGMDFSYNTSGKKKNRGGSSSNIGGAGENECSIKNRLHSGSVQQMPVDITYSLDQVMSESKGWFIDKGAGETILQRAAKMGHTDVVAYTIAMLKMDVNVKDNAGIPPIHKAAFRGHDLIVDILLRYGHANPNASVKGTRPLHEAVESGNLYSVNSLMAYGADPSIHDYSGNLPTALCQDNPQLLHYLNAILRDIKGEDSDIWSLYGESSYYTPTVDDVQSTSDGLQDEDSFGFLCSETPFVDVFDFVPPQSTYSSRSNGSWYMDEVTTCVLKSDLSEKVDLDSHDSLESLLKSRTYELTRDEFVSGVSISTMSCNGESILSVLSSSAPASLVEIVKFDDEIKKLLGIETVDIS